MSNDIFTYPYPLEADDPGDATKITADYQALVGRINANLQTGKAFSLAYRNVYVGTSKFYTNLIGQVFAWDMARSGTIEAAGCYLSWEDGLTYRGALFFWNETTALTLGGYSWDIAKSPFHAPIALTTATVEQDDNISLRITEEINQVTTGVELDGLSLSAWLVVRSETEV